MDLDPTDDQRQLQEMIARFAQDRFPIDVVRAWGRPDGFSRARWRELAELGTFAITVTEDRGGTGHARNIPVPQGFNDSEMDWVLRHAILPVARHLRPEAIMLQCGADALEDDPLSRLSLSNTAHRAVALALMAEAPRLIVLGGGGYNPWSVARCWAGVWAALNGFAGVRSARVFNSSLLPAVTLTVAPLTTRVAARRRRAASRFSATSRVVVVSPPIPETGTHHSLQFSTLCGPTHS